MQQPETTSRPDDVALYAAAWHSPVPGELSLRIDTVGVGSGATVVVWVEGEIDLASVPALRDVFELAFEQGTHLVVDLRGVQFINGAGVAALAAAAEAARGGGGTFTLRRPSPISRKVLRILGVEESLCGEAS
ncbi:MAG: STAS domain-containing protein [Acidimicrobiales bacterium]